MSKKHPIIALTGSAGAGTSTLKTVIHKLFLRKNINPTFVQGDSFRQYDFDAWDEVFAEYADRGQFISHFGPEANEFEKLETLFKSYGVSGTGDIRHYLQTSTLASKYKKPKGCFSDYEAISRDSDVLVYDGFHGGLVTEGWSRRPLTQSHNPEVQALREETENKAPEADVLDIAQYVDLLVGVTPSMNLEWIQKIHRDVNVTKIEPSLVSEAILRRMPDYIKYIIPQFSLTDINFQRVPLVDTSNPFIARDIPSLDESVIITRFREPLKHDLTSLLAAIEGSFMSRPNTLVIPGCEFEYAIMVIFEPILDRLFQDKIGLM